MIEIPQLLVTTTCQAKNAGSFDEIVMEVTTLNINFEAGPILQLFVLLCVRSVNHSTEKSQIWSCV